VPPTTPVAPTVLYNHNYSNFNRNSNSTIIIINAR